MNTIRTLITHLFLIITLMSSCIGQKGLDVEIFETSGSGNKLKMVKDFPSMEENVIINILPDEKFQILTGIGGSFTESSAYLLNQISKENRDKILEAYFGESGARYSLTRTHINSCDFSLGNYSYAPVEGDVELMNTSIENFQKQVLNIFFTLFVEKFGRTKLASLLEF